jgi:hypothetical protein
MPAQVTINTRQNADWIKSFHWTQGDQPVNLVGTLVLQVRKSPGDSKVLINLTSADDGPGLMITNASQGRFTVHIPLEQLQDLPSGQYVHDLVFRREDGVSLLLWEGALVHKSGVSR